MTTVRIGARGPLRNFRRSRWRYSMRCVSSALRRIRRCAACYPERTSLILRPDVPSY